MTEGFKKRYREKIEEGSELLWPSDREDSVTRKFYRDISHLSKKTNHRKTRRNLIFQIIKIIIGRGGSPIGK
tara:strand:- start:733 stop:948 length:216 start_codon:yes stop_codon:yes gene_type:complete